MLILISVCSEASLQRRLGEQPPGFFRNSLDQNIPDLSEWWRCFKMNSYPQLVGLAAYDDFHFTVENSLVWRWEVFESLEEPLKPW